MHTQISQPHQSYLDSDQHDTDQVIDQDFDDYQPELDRRNFGQVNPLTPDEKRAIGNILDALSHV